MKKIQSFSLGTDIIERLVDFADESGLSRSKVVENALSVYFDFFALEEREFNLVRDRNYAFLAKTRWGKTTYVKHIIQNRNPKVILDPHREYCEVFGEAHPIDFHQKLLPLTEDEARRVVLSQLSTLIEEALEKIVETDGLVLRPRFSNDHIERLFINQLFHELLRCHIETKEDRLLVVEEAQRYEDGLKSLVSQGLKNGLQVILITQFPLQPEILLNTNIVLGKMWSSLLEQTPLPQAIKTHALMLSKQRGKGGPFLFEDPAEENWVKLKPLQL